MGYAGDDAMPGGFGTARQAAAGWSDSAFEAVFFEYYGRLVAILYRMVGDRARAEELASDAFLKLFQQAASPAHYDNIGGWLYRTAVRLGIDSLRAALRRKAHEPEAGRDLAGGGAGPLDDLLRAERVERVRRVLSRLRPRDADLLTLRADGLSYRELSAALGIKLASVGRALARAEEAFEKAYARQERAAGLR